VAARPSARRAYRAIVAIGLALLVAGASALVLTESPDRPGPGSLLPGDWRSSAALDDVPAALFAPWADRAGFNATDVAEAQRTVAATGNATVELTLWPSSPALYAAPPAGGPPMTSAQIASAYGPSVSQYEALERYFGSDGLSITPSPDRLSLEVSGPTGRLGAAFQTTLEDGISNGQTVMFPDRVPTLPPSLAPLVEAVSGLSTDLSRFVLPLAPVPSPAAHPSQSASPITPNDIHVIYGLNDLYNYSGSAHWATGQGLAVVLWGSGYDPQDISTFLSQIYPSDFPQPKINDYPVDGAPSPSPGAINDPSNASQELTLDIEWAVSEAPGATIDVVYAPDGPSSDGYSPTDATMEAAINEAINSVPGVTVLSMSFGSLDGGDPPFQVALSQDFAVAAQKDITVVAASGDSGGMVKGQPQCSGGTAPQFPAASPEVLAVGGTAPVLSQNAFGTVTGLASEPAWDDSGGGYSTDYPAPSWQLVGSAAGQIRANGGDRGIPDVAGPAATNLFYYNGGLDYGSGTSFATPMWAGLIAEMDAVRGAPLGFLTDRLYALAGGPSGAAAAGLADITGGSTCITSAGPGWDAATGWGTPRAEPLYEHIAGTYVDVNLSASPSSVGPGGTVAVSAVVTNTTSHRPIDALSVDLAMSGSFPGPYTGTLSTVSNATTNALGATNVTMTIPSCYLGSSVSITATVDSGGYLGDNSTTVGINLLGLAGLIALSETFPYNVAFFAVIMAVALGIGLWFGRRRPARRAAAGPPAPPATTARMTPAPVPTAAPPPPPPPARTPVPNPPPPRPSDPWGDEAPPAPVPSPSPEGPGPAAPAAPGPPGSESA
jgi:kumamolisin